MKTELSIPRPRRAVSPGSCSGRTLAMWVLFLGSAVALVTLLAMLLWPARRGDDRTSKPLFIHCAAGLRVPAEAVAREYAKAYGVPVEFNFGASQTLLANLAVSPRGDLYLPGDQSYIGLARSKGLVDEAVPVAQMQAVLAVRKGNPKAVHGIADLSRPGLGLSQANPEAAAIGKLVQEALEQSGQWASVKLHTTVSRTTVQDVANDLKLGAAAAGFIWDAMLRQYPELEAVPTPELSRTSAQITVGVLHGCAQPAAALKFARYLAAQDQGQRVFVQEGYQAGGGDVWAPEPELRLMAGAMLRPAIEQTVTDFELREGVRVTRVYNGCGILLAQMRAGTLPDAYFSCDRSFMAQVTDLYLDPEDLSLNTMVILVPKGNPHAIRELKDLAKPGLQLGVGHEKQSALGALTRRLLETNGLYEAIHQNVKTESATGDFLVNQLRAGSLDAVIVYVSNASASREALDVIPITVPGGFAIQPMALGKQARYPQLAARLLEAFRSPKSRQRFEALGFQWKGPVPGQ